MMTALVEAYGDAVDAFMRSPDEESRERAYELGRSAIQLGLGVLDISRIHTLALERRRPADVTGVRCWQFFSEVLAPFEMALRGVRDANATLKRFNQVLEERVAERTEELRATERRLREQTDVLVNVLDAMADAVLVVDLERQPTLTNRAAATLLPVDGGALVGPRYDAAIFEPDETTPIARSDRPLARALRGEVVRERDVFVRSPGQTGQHLCLTASPLRDERDTMTGVVLVARDTTARKRAEEAARKAEERLVRAQKLDAVGQLAGGVAHDFNNLLAVILSYSSLVVDELPAEDTRRADVLQIQQAATSAATLTRQLLAFSRQQVLELRPLDLNEVVEELARMLVRTLGEHIELAVVPGSDIGLVMADRGQVEQVLMNLAVNARDAMPTGGKLTIETSRTESREEDEPLARSSVAPGEYVVLAVSDTGIGMDEATKARIFEPFFTTKERGRGTGLGLATVYGIVRQTGGQVAVYSEPGRGTTFRVYLPVARGAEVRPAPSSSTAARGSETILLVEDDERVRVVATRVLRAHGYDVLVASGPREARAIFDAHAGTIHLLMTDMVMPGASGTELALQLAALRPDMQLLFMSGYAAGGALRSGAMPEGVAFLEKPFTVDSLRAKVREVLDGASQRRERGG